jgi:hypothetical protein
VSRYDPRFLAIIAGIGSAKKNQRWPPFPERDRFKRVWQFQALASTQHTTAIILPTLAIKIDREKQTGLIKQPRVHPHREWMSKIIVPQQMMPDGFVSDWQKPTIGTLSAFYPRFFANAADPFVGAGRRVTATACFAALKSPRINIFAATE